jgi:SHAQKYF class myb-like DNA-binding protein
MCALVDAAVRKVRSEIETTRAETTAARPDHARAPTEASKKTRKPYVRTKTRSSWTRLEHEKFLQALELYGRAWKKIEAHVETRTAAQIRSHAQKCFQKSCKSKHPIDRSATRTRDKNYVVGTSEAMRVPGLERWTVTDVGDESRRKERQTLPRYGFIHRYLASVFEVNTSSSGFSSSRR